MSVLQNGVYNIQSLGGSFLEFSSNQANLTLWSYSAGSPQQQWNVQAVGSGSYSIQNSQYNTYISTSTPSAINSLVQQSSTAYNWSIRLNATAPNQYVIASDDSFSLALNDLDEGTAQNTPVQLYSCCYDVNGFDKWDLFQFIASNTTSTTTPNQSSSSSTTSSVWFVVAIVFIALFGATVLGLIIGVVIARRLGYRWNAPRPNPGE